MRETEKKEYVWNSKFFLIVFFVILAFLLAILAFTFFRNMAFADISGQSSDIEIVDLNINN